MGIKAFFIRVRWGAKSLVALYLSVLSGIVLSLQYDPASSFYSVNTIDILVPFGVFWRSLHFYASQVFFLLFSAHLVAILWGDEHKKMSLPNWVKLIATLPVTILLLFSGYVLRGDSTGRSAGIIAENIALSVPLIGKWINELLFSVSTYGLRRIYANHLIGLGIVWLMLSWEHVRRYRLNWRRQWWLVPALVGSCLFLAAPMESARLGVFRISAPWFFLGIKELLRFIQPFWAGVMFPLSFVLALFFMRKDREGGGECCRRFVLIYILICLGFYLILTVAASWSWLKSLIRL